MILSSIAAMARNRAIGVGNKLPWNLPEDLKYFKEKTKGRILIMGRKTFESLPGALPNRFHILVTRDQNYIPTKTNLNEKDFAVVHSLDEAYSLARMLLDSKDSRHRESFGNEVFIVGGAEIYKQSLKDIDRLYLTVIEQDFPGDAFFPEFSDKDWVLTKKEDRQEPIPFSFRVYYRQR